MAKKKKRTSKKQKQAVSKPSYNMFWILLVMVAVAAVAIIYVNRRTEINPPIKPDKRTELPLGNTPDADINKP